MEYEVEYTDEFGEWWITLDEDLQVSIDAKVRLLETRGPNLPFPHSSGMKNSRHSRMRELRIQHKGDPYRIFYAFDPRRVAILLIGGNKAGNGDWYDKYPPIADDLYDEHLHEIAGER